MKKHLRCWSGAATVAVFALAMSSCAYDPNYMAGGSYSSGYAGDYGYGDGYGYGYSGFSTSLFVSTGDPRWGYDPYCHSYYDYTRRCYYDPYLYGYYPIGHRPVVVVGVPHPHGYNRSYCPPPNRVRNYSLANYHNRADAYRNSNYAWARQVSQPSGNRLGQPQFQPKPKPYSQTGNLNYQGNRNLTPAAGTYPRTYNGSTYKGGGTNPALHGQSNYPATSTGPIRTGPQGNLNQGMKGKYGPSTPYQGSPQVRPSGPAPQPQVREQAPPPRTKSRGLGQADEGKDGGGGRSRR